MPSSETLPKVESKQTGRRTDFPWWVEVGKWLLAQFLFPVIVCAFLLYNQHTVGTDLVRTLQAVEKAVIELKNAVQRNSP